MTRALAVRAPAGLGKTTEVQKCIANLPPGSTAEIYVPTHALADEVGQNLRALYPKLTVKVIGGRSHPGPDGEPLCKKHELAEKVAQAGAEVYSTLCAQEKGKVVERCEHYAMCPYIAQFEPAQVTIYPHAYLTLNRMTLEPPVPAIAIVDETFFQSCIEIFEVPISLLRASFLGPLARGLCTQIEYALTHELPLIGHLYSQGIAFEQFPEALSEIERGAPRITPLMGLKQRLRALKLVKQRTDLYKLLDTVRRECFTGRHVSHGLTYCATTQIITVHTKKPIRRFHDRQGNEARVLLIDANASELLTSQFFENPIFHRVPASRRATVIQCKSTRCSTTSLVPAKNADPQSKRDAEQRLADLNAFIARVAAQHERVLVIGPQEITGNAKSAIEALIKAPSNVDLAHFNSIRGIDRWKDHNAAIVIGRNQPGIEAVEAIARCVSLTDRETLRFATDWAVEERGYSLKHGQMGVDVVCHPDPRVQTILEQLREGESQQAIDRLRLVHATTPKLVYILSNVVLDIVVDQLLTWDELMAGGTRVQQAWSRLKGAMPRAPAWLATTFPDLWQSAAAAKCDVGRAIKEDHFSNIDTIRNLTLFEHQYRPPPAPGRGRRQRSWSVCVSSDAEPTATRVALEALLGVGVEMRHPETPGVPLR